MSGRSRIDRPITYALGRSLPAADRRHATHGHPRAPGSGHSRIALADCVKASRRTSGQCGTGGAQAQAFAVAIVISFSSYCSVLPDRKRDIKHHAMPSGNFARRVVAVGDANEKESPREDCAAWSSTVLTPRSRATHTMHADGRSVHVSRTLLTSGQAYNEHRFCLVRARFDAAPVGLGNLARDVQSEPQTAVVMSVQMVLATLERIKDAVED